MNNGKFLIPANSKKSLLIFGIFNKFDAILFGSGIGISILLMMILPVADIVWAIIAIAPVAITGFLVFPVPNYHNVMTVLIEFWQFITSRQKFIWKGWCLTSDEKNSEK
jgi:hypothetical protein